MSSRTVHLSALGVVALLMAAAPAPADYADNFGAYTAGIPLAGQGPWLPSMPIQNRILVNTASSGISVWSDSGKTGIQDLAYLTVTEPSAVHFSIDIKGMHTTTSDYDWWEIDLKTDTGMTAASWSGRVDRFTTWGWTGSQTTMMTLGAQLPMEAVLDFSAGTIDYYYNHFLVYSDTYSFSPGTGIAEIDIISRGFGSPFEVIPNEHIYLNKLLIEQVPEPISASLLAAGAMALLGRRRRS